MKELHLDNQNKTTGRITEYDRADMLALRVTIYDAVYFRRTSKFRFEGTDFMLYCDSRGNLLLKHEWSGNTRATNRLNIKRMKVDLPAKVLLNFAYAMRQMIKEDCEELA